MTSRAALVVPRHFHKNLIFSDSHDNAYNRDNFLARFRDLRDQFARKGIDLCTDDIQPPQSALFALFINVASNRTTLPSRVPTYIILTESQLIRPDNYAESSLRDFAKIFTWRDDLVDGTRFVKTNYAFDLSSPRTGPPFATRKLCTMIAGNRHVGKHPLELYSERLQIIEYLEKHAPKSFDLYGRGWDRRYFHGSRVVRQLNRFGVLCKLFATRRPSYRGPVSNKADVLQQYKFAFCYENARDIPGYVTEKIFDALLANTIPVYKGAPNIEDLVPPDCYVDATQFDRPEEILEHIQSLPLSQARKMLQAGRDYLTSAAAQPFTSRYFADTVVSHIVEDLSMRALWKN